MRIAVNRKPVKFYPDPTRTILRFFRYDDARSKQIINRVIDLGTRDTNGYLNLILEKFAIRHRNVTKVFSKHYEQVKYLQPDLNKKSARIPMAKKLLIGAYFTMEYSMESAAFFNPSVVRAPDQYGLVEGRTKIIISFRAIGEGHISSIVFRTGIVDSNGEFEFLPSGDKIEEASIIKHHLYVKKDFTKKLKEMKVSPKLTDHVLKELHPKFYYRDLKQAVDHVMLNNKLNMEQRYELEEIMWLGDSHYEIDFSLDTDVSERVIFPISDYERNGIEDARFVEFHDNNETTYYATYTAYDGYTILPKLLETKDFYRFKVRPLHGHAAKNKNLALFPRKINGKYVMMSRIDGQNNYITYSDHLGVWENPIQIQEPKYPWEFVQIGNCGSPIETEKGWLIITHGVGAMRTYCLGASLFDLNEPEKELGRLAEPLLVPRAEEMEGYVPNVVYSCGAIICHDQVIIPYGMSDYGASIVTVPLNELLSKILNA